jgi:BT1 family
MLAAPLSTFCYSYWGPGTVVTMLAIAPLPMLPLIYLFYEDSNLVIQPTREQLREIWNTVSSRCVWQPMAFIYLYKILQVQNLAWRQYLKTVLDFDAAQLNSLLVASYICLFFGTLAYKFFFLKSSWRRVYQACIVVNGILTALQLLLITGHTFGLSNFWFALGDEAAAEFVAGIHFLVEALILVNLCPPGSEGASYAMFTTCANAALLLGPTISSLLLPIWDVRVEALMDGALSGLFRLSILTIIIKSSPIFLLWLLPRSPEELFQLGSRPISKAGSTLSGCLFLGITAASVAYVYVIGIFNIIKPGWAGKA